MSPSIYDRIHKALPPRFRLTSVKLADLCLESSLGWEKHIARIVLLYQNLKVVTCCLEWRAKCIYSTITILK